MFSNALCLDSSTLKTLSEEVIQSIRKTEKVSFSCQNTPNFILIQSALEHFKLPPINWRNQSFNVQYLEEKVLSFVKEKSLKEKNDRDLIVEQNTEYEEEVIKSTLFDVFIKESQNRLAAEIQLIHRLEEQLEEEPQGGTDVVDIAVRLTSGKVAKRRFRLEGLGEQIYHWVISVSMKDGIVLKPGSFILKLPPDCVLDQSKSLLGNGITQRCFFEVID